MSVLKIFSEAAKNFFNLVEPNADVRALINTMDSTSKVNYGFGLGMKAGTFSELVGMIKKVKGVEVVESTIKFNPIRYFLKANKVNFKAYWIKADGLSFAYLCYNPVLKLAFFRHIENRNRLIFTDKFLKPYKVSEKLNFENMIQGISSRTWTCEDDLLFVFLKAFARTSKFSDDRERLRLEEYSHSYFVLKSSLENDYIFDAQLKTENFAIYNNGNSTEPDRITGFVINDVCFTFKEN